MKKQRFVKKVEWEKRPEMSYVLLFFGIGIVSLLIIILLAFPFGMAPLSDMGRVALAILFWTIFIICIWTIYDSLGEGKKVYWEKI